MSTAYHFAPAETKPTRRVEYFEEQQTRLDLRCSKRSNWSAWALTVLAIAVGAIGGSQISTWHGQSTATTMAQTTSVSDILPAAGSEQQGFVIEKAGDGKFYADFDIAGKVVTMQLDPYTQSSRLIAADRLALTDQAREYGDVVVLPMVRFAAQDIQNPAFLQASSEMSHSVVGMDLLSQIDGLRMGPKTIRILR